MIASNDDISTNQPNSRVTFHATANTVYDIAVDGYDGEPGNIHLDIAMAQAVFTLAPPRPLPDGSHTVTLTGQPGQRYTLESSTDMRAWQPVATLPSNSSGIVEFSDPAAVNVSVRFYRASLAGGG